MNGHNASCGSMYEDLRQPGEKIAWSAKLCSPGGQLALRKSYVKELHNGITLRTTAIIQSHGLQTGE